MARVLLDGVRKVYDNGQVAVQGASFEVADGELLVLVGPSGCGKSTLLRMVAGLEQISAGTLRIGERVVNDVAPKDRDIAMVFQNYALYPHMTVAQNMAFGLKLQGLDKATVQARVDAAAAVLGLASMLDKLPRALSGGQRQRVALGRALVREPAVFLLDEPLSNLDAKLRHAVRTEIAQLHRKLGTTMIYVTHDQVEAMTLGQRIVVLNEGVVQQIDTPMALYDRPVNLFVAGFLGSPAMNQLPGVLQHDGDQLWLQRDSGQRLPLPAGGPTAADGPVVLGVRPEHLRWVQAGQGTAMQVSAVEPIGSEAYVHVEWDGQPLVLRVPPAALPAPGSAIEVAIDPAGLHLFDAGTGLRRVAG